jgi:hypothetical protein
MENETKTVDIKIEYNKTANTIPKIVEFISHQLVIRFQIKNAIKLK